MNRVSMVLACAAMLFAVQPAASEDASSSDLAQMRELVQGLQQKVDAQQEQLEHQGQLLEQAQAVAREQQDEEARSGLSSFLDQIEVGGHVATSYSYNTNTPKNRNSPNSLLGGLQGGYGANGGPSGLFLPFHQDDNTFTVDQIDFEISKPATEESRAGFGFGILFGQDANFLGQGTLVNNNGNPLSRRTQNLDGTSDYYVTQAYLEYQCGCLGPEITFTAGKFMTMVGGEVYQSPSNFNITRGDVYTLLQPVDHMGLLASTDLGPTNITVGIVNSGGSGFSSPDFNNEKSYVASVYVGDDRLNVRTSFIYGAEGTPNGQNLDSQRQGLVDVTAWFNPTESLSLWANYDYLYLEETGLYANGIALAGRAQLTEKVGLALRGEYVREHPANSIPGQQSFFVVVDDNRSTELYSVTLTGDYALTDHLTMRAESRADFVKAATNGVGFFKNHNGMSDKQVVLLAELVYEF